jgi:hypothetical protein
MRSPRQRSLLILAVIAVLVIAFAAIPSVRFPILRAAGRALVSSDAVARADIIVVATGADGAGVLEAADLVHSGVATRVAVFADPPDRTVDREFIRRGLPYEDEAERSLRQLAALGVKRTEVIPRAVAGSEDESRALPAWCDQHRFDAVVVVTTTDHTRRLSRVLRRAMKGHVTRVGVRASRYSPFDAERWWERRGNARTAIIELQKLFLDLAPHPFG